MKSGERKALTSLRMDIFYDFKRNNQKNEIPNFNLLTHYLILQNCIFIACASMEKQTKKIIPDNNKKWLAHFFALSLSLFFHRPFFFISFSSLDSYHSFHRRFLLVLSQNCVYTCILNRIVNFWSLHWRSTLRKKSKKKMIVLSYFCLRTEVHKKASLMALFIQ